MLKDIAAKIMTQASKAYRKMKGIARSKFFLCVKLFKHGSNWVGNVCHANYLGNIRIHSNNNPIKLLLWKLI